MLKRFIIFALIFISLFLFGCGENDAIEEPTPRPVRTPSPPLIIDSEPECRHFWRKPDCLHPYICYDCGEEEGVPTDHVWLPANFQTGPVCEKCGEIGGDPVEPNFIRYGYRINTTSGRRYDYITTTSQNPDLETIGTAILLYIDIFESDEEYPFKDGYEYIVARIMIQFDDENARDYGFTYITGHLDFFGFDPNEIAVAHNDLRESDIAGFNIGNTKLNYYGEDYEYYLMHTQFQNEWIGDISYIVLEYVFLVPGGYDGMVVYIANAANWSDDENRFITDNFDSETLFFRLRVQST